MSTDFPRVFFLMHKWFMDSSTLIDVLFDLYNLYNQYEEQYEQETDKHYYENQQLKICFAFKLIQQPLSNENKISINIKKFLLIKSFWIKTFPFHFAVDTNLLESLKRFSNINVKRHKDHLFFFDISNM